LSIAAVDEKRRWEVLEALVIGFVVENKRVVDIEVRPQ
jgi:hypothetical protein